MSIQYDREADAAYISVGRAARKGEAVRQVTDIPGLEAGGEIILDFDAWGHLIGVEILQASTLLRPEDLDGAERIDHR